MRLHIITKTRSKRPGVTHLTGTAYEVAVSASPIKGAANKEVIETLAKYFGLRKNQVQIISGHTAVNKTVELSE